MDAAKEFCAIILSFCAGLALIVAAIMFMVQGPHLVDHWELDYQSAKIEKQLREKCLKDKYYCNPQNYNVEVK